jgi:hypothetical protein
MKRDIKDIIVQNKQWVFSLCMSKDTLKRENWEHFEMKNERNAHRLWDFLLRTGAVEMEGLDWWAYDNSNFTNAYEAFISGISRGQTDYEIATSVAKFKIAYGEDIKL